MMEKKNYMPINSHRHQKNQKSASKHDAFLVDGGRENEELMAFC